VTAGTERAAPGRGPVPAVGPSAGVTLPEVAERTLASGLRVAAVRRPGVPVVEVRLRLPFATTGVTDAAQAAVLAETLLAGTERHDRAALAAALQSLGGSLATALDADRLLVRGHALAPELPRLLELLGGVLTGASHPEREVAVERDRIIQELLVARSQPSVVAQEALLQRLYGDHPYGRDLPDADAVAAVSAAELREMHDGKVRPAGGLMVLVGDLEPEASLDAVAAALESWTTAGAPAAASPVAMREPGPMLLVDRPGSVQSTLRLAGPAVARDDPGYAPLVLANLVFGGYFSSRLVANIRERHGYTYSPNSSIEHPLGGSRLTVGADVSTAVTAPALMETRYELGRIATLPVGQAELDAARRYATGSLAIATASSAGLAGTLTALLAAGLGAEWLRDHPLALEAVTVDEVLAAGARHLAPARLRTVVVGDAGLVAEPLATLGEVEAGT
jgi:zinc protease